MNNEGQYQGARFYKCALQVNPHTYARYRGEPVPDEEDYNNAILQQCKQNKIKVVGLADHGKVESSESLRAYLKQNGLTVFPGFEIASSEKIHMVCLYPDDSDLAQLNQWLGQLMGANNKELAREPTHASSLSCEQIAKEIKTQGGFWYAAHMTGKNGLLKLDGSGGNLVHLWKKEEVVVAGQIPGKIEALQLERDLAKYRQIIENKNPDYKRGKPLVIINAKDIDKPETLSESSASCLVKMTKPDFKAFKQAFHDTKSRIRLNHDNPEQPYSVIRSIQWEGAGFFAEDTLCFSQHLNAVIGGRGTGKSTLVEGIRYVLGLPVPEGSNRELNEFHKNNLGDSKITLSVTSKAQSGQHYTISRRFGEQAIVKNEHGEKSHLSPKDILPAVKLLGQNEILEIEKNEDEKLALINSFLPDIDKFDETLREIKQRMAANRDKWVKADEDFEQLKSSVQKEAKLKEQLKRFKKLGVEEKLKNVDMLEKEENIQARIKHQIEQVQGWLKGYEEIFDLEFLRESRISALPNGAILAKVREMLERLKRQLDSLANQAGKNLKDAVNEHGILKKEWQSKADTIKDELQRAIAQLPEQAGKEGKELGKEYTDIIKALARINRQKSEYMQQEDFIKALKKERETLLDEYRETAFQRFTALEGTVKDLNQNDLKGKVKLNVKRFGNLKPLKDFLLDIENIGEAKIKWLDEITELDLSAWSKWIEERNSQALMDKYKSIGLQKNTAERLSMLDLKKRLESEEIELKDTISIELNVAHDEKENYRPLEDLSTGQKCTAILNLLLLNCNDPLIIDQPEDHLDNAFIADRIVRDLREFKIRRQFIFATHNANIPVFGDAELITVLHSDKDEGKIKVQGSIDKPQVCEQAAEILEGGEAAFEMRKHKYGY